MTRFPGITITLLALTLAGCSADNEPAEKAPDVSPANVIRVAGEELTGELLDSETGLVAFRGIPYAAPPIGPLRWKPPAPHTPREGPQSAKDFGSVCPQGQGNADFYRVVASMTGADADIPDTANIDEDCLNLNVWSTATGSDKRLPVMLWIHGGGNTNGHSADPDYFGHSLAARGVVFVSINYRLGLFGFMAHPGLSAESPEKVSGNYGLLDQLAALEWVQQNIAEFGGDPGNVTLFGESAGGANIASLIASPLGEGLFQRAIIQSGGYEIQSLYSLADAEAIGITVATGLGFEASNSDADVVAGMRALSWQQVLQFQQENNAVVAQAINADGVVLPTLKSTAFKLGNFSNVDLLAGANENERYMWLEPDPAGEEFAQGIAEYGSPWSEQLNELLAGDIENDLALARDRLGSAVTFLCGSDYIAASMAGQGANVFFYYFTRVRPGAENILAYHGAEIPYALDTHAEWLPHDATDDRLTDVMTQYWLNFAASGNPNGPGLPEWPNYDPAMAKYMDLGDSVTAIPAADADLCGVLQDYWLSRVAAAD